MPDSGGGVLAFAPMDGVERTPEELRRMNRRQGAIARVLLTDAAWLRRLNAAMVDGWHMRVGVN